MTGAAMIPHLAEDHARVRVVAAKLSRFLDRARAPIEIDFARCRWELIRELSLHLACERRLMARLSMSDDTLDRELHRHTAAWNGATIQKRWPAYVADARALLRRLAQRMEHEERVIFPMLG